MSKRKMKHGKALVLAVALIISAMVLPKVYAAIAVDTNRKCSLEIDVQTSGFSELNEHPVEVNIYKVADITSTGEYKAVDGFTTLDFSDISSNTTAQNWEEKAALAKEEVDQLQMEPTAQTSTASGSTILDNLQVGLYLIDAQQLLTDDYQYDFIPYLISLPNNYYQTSGDGSWVYDLTGSHEIGLKPNKSDRYGDLIIEKMLDVYNATNGGATFVFQIEGVKRDNDTKVDKVVYSDVVSMTFNSPGTDRITIEDIPAGATVTVREVYSGASYQLTSSPESTVVIQAEGEEGDPATVAFSNTYDERLNGGNGIVNTFTYQEDGSWTHSATEDSTP